MEKAPESLISLSDLMLTPVFLLLICFYTLMQVSRYRKTPLAGYFIYGLGLKIAMTFLFFLVCEYWFKGGDTFAYYGRIQGIRNAFYENPIKILSEYFRAIFFGEDFTYNSYFISLEDATKSVATLSGLLGLLTNAGYLCTSLLLALFSFLGVWKIFLLFYQKFPKAHFHLALSALFVPSVSFWGSGILKDSFSIGALGFLLFSANNLFLLRRNIPGSVLSVLFFSWVLINTKPYILFCIIPFFLLMVYTEYMKRIKNAALRNFIKPVFLMTVLSLLILIIINLGSIVEKYAFENIVEEINSKTSFINRNTEYYGGSGYQIGRFSTDPADILRLIPNAIIVTFFRPYFWEISNPLMAFSALESFFILLLTLFIIYKMGPLGFWRAIRRNSLIQFSLSFAMLFAFFVGIMSFNFGTIVRYKIPCIPFYLLSMSALYYIHQQSKKPVHG